MKTEAIFVRTDPATKRALEKMAAAGRRSLSSQVDVIVAEYLARNKARPGSKPEAA